ncbi:hypothetical protein V496_10306, partial [Pseudogymnoascus sp. VKM F-4515 (FW-2607)]
MIIQNSEVKRLNHAPEHSPQYDFFNISEHLHRPENIRIDDSATSLISSNSSHLPQPAYNFEYTHHSNISPTSPASFSAPLRPPNRRTFGLFSPITSPRTPHPP